MNETFKMDKQRLTEYINKLANTKILVVGDLAIDEMIYGDTERISREAPVLILQHTSTQIILGAASNAAHNVSKINNGKVAVVGVVGTDFQAKQLKEAFNVANVDCRYLVEDSERKTVTKTRISGSCSQSITQQIVRIDRQTKTPLSSETEEKVIKQLEKAIPLYDAVILSDYHIGVLTENIINKAIEIANINGKIIVVDAQKDLDKYKNITSMTPNLPDTQKFVGFELDSTEDIVKAGRILLEKTNAKFILITCGDEGMITVEKDKYTKIPVFNKSEVFDVTGAGDTVTALYTMALTIGAKPEYAAVIGNIAASIVIKQFGSATTSIEEILEKVSKFNKEIIG